MMRQGFAITLLLGIIFVQAVAPMRLTADPEAKPQILGVPLDEIGKEFRAEPYLQAAAALQAKGKDAAYLELMTEARRSTHNAKANEAIVVLSRMLFTAPATEPFRPARLGRPILVGGGLEDRISPSSVRPLEPIVIVDGVPFCITYGYELDGRPETADAYLAYCITHCEWTATRFAPTSPARMREAFSQLLEFRGWKRPLTEQERRFLAVQVETPAASSLTSAAPDGPPVRG